MKSHHALLFTLAICAGMTRAEAQTLYGATSSGHGELYVLDPSTGGVITDVGALNDASAHNYSVSGLAFDPLNGVLYGSTGGASGTLLLTINTSSGLVTTVGSFGVGSATMTDLAFNSAGQLFGISSSGGANLYSINIGTGAASIIGSSGISFTEGGGLAISGAGTFYGTPIPGQFGTYNPSTGAYSNISTPASPAGSGGTYAALTFGTDGTTLYGDNLIPGIGGGASHLVTIDTTSGTVTDIGASVAHLDAIAIAPVPEPGTVALISLGGLVLLTRVRRKQS